MFVPSIGITQRASLDLSAIFPQLNRVCFNVPCRSQSGEEKTEKDL